MQGRASSSCSSGGSSQEPCRGMQVYRTSAIWALQVQQAVQQAVHSAVHQVGEEVGGMAVQQAPQPLNPTAQSPGHLSSSSAAQYKKSMHAVQYLRYAFFTYDLAPIKQVKNTMNSSIRLASSSSCLRYWGAVQVGSTGGQSGERLSGHMVWRQRP
jgi:hypothetical protein